VCTSCKYTMGNLMHAHRHVPLKSWAQCELEWWFLSGVQHRCWGGGDQRQRRIRVGQSTLHALHCAVPGSQLGEDGVPACTEDINRFQQVGWL
jgi:hypothetical protein